jgi:hypothetical protein
MTPISIRTRWRAFHIWLALLLVHAASLGCSDDAPVAPANSDAPVIPTAVEVSPADRTVALGFSEQFTATVVNSDGSRRDATGEVVWSTDDSAVAGVSNAAGEAGRVTSAGVGMTQVIATHVASGLSASASVTVTPAELSAITVSPSDATIEIIETRRFVATGTFSDGSTADISTSVQWSTSDTNVATASNAPGGEGLVEPLALGTVTVNAEHLESGVSSADSEGSALLTIVPPGLVSIRITPLAASIAAGLPQAFQAFGTYSDLAEHEITDEVEWSSSDDLVAGVSAGVATGLIPGTATISAEDPVTGVTSDAESAVLTVEPPLLLSIFVTPAMPSIPQLTSLELTATGRYTDGVDRDLTADPDVVWESSSAAVVVDANGLAEGVLVGEASVSATHTPSGISSDDTFESAIVEVTVPALVSIEVSAPLSTVPAGVDLQLTATGTYDNGTNADVTDAVTWTSSSPTVAEVSNVAATRGLARTLAEGQTTFDAADSASGVSSAGSGGSLVVTVAAGVTLVSVAVAPAAQSLPLGGTFPFTASATFSDSSTHTVTESVTWGSATPGVATVDDDEGERGLVTAVGAGTSVISATHLVSGIGSGGQSGLVTVSATQVAEIVHYELETGSGSVAVNLAPGQPNGTINGAVTWLAPGGAPGTSLFGLRMADGVTTNVNPNLSTFTATNLTIEFWWRFSNGTNLSYMWNSASSFRAFTNGVAFAGLYVRETPGGTDVIHTPSIQTSAWHHIAYVLDATAFQGRLYVNGVLSGSTSYAGSITLTNLFVLGQNSTNGATTDFDRYRVWSRALTAQQITSAFNGSF